MPIAHLFLIDYGVFAVIVKVITQHFAEGVFDFDPVWEKEMEILEEVTAIISIWNVLQDETNPVAVWIDQRKHPGLIGV